MSWTNSVTTSSNLTLPNGRKSLRHRYLYTTFVNFSRGCQSGEPIYGLPLPYSPAGIHIPTSPYRLGLKMTNQNRDRPLRARLKIGLCVLSSILSLTMEYINTLKFHKAGNRKIFVTLQGSNFVIYSQKPQGKNFLAHCYLSVYSVFLFCTLRKNKKIL